MGNAGSTGCPGSESRAVNIRLHKITDGVNTPWRACRRPAYISAVKTNCRKKPMTFGEFIAAAHDAWGGRRASGLVELAVNANIVQFRRPQRFVFSKRNLSYLPF